MAKNHTPKVKPEVRHTAAVSTVRLHPLLMDVVYARTRDLRRVEVLAVRDGLVVDVMVR